MIEVSRQYWLHRISWCGTVSFPLLKKGYLSIGWSELSTYNFLIATKKNGKCAIDNAIQSKYNKLAKYVSPQI